MAAIPIELARTTITIVSPVRAGDHLDPSSISCLPPGIFDKAISRKSEKTLMIELDTVTCGNEVKLCMTALMYSTLSSHEDPAGRSKDASYTPFLLLHSFSH